MGTKIELTTSPITMDQCYIQFYKEKKEREKNQSYTKEKGEKNTKLSREEYLMKLQPPKYKKFPELEELTTETLIAIHEERWRSASVKKLKASYYSEKKNGFQNNTPVFYRRIFDIESFAHQFLKSDGKVDIAKLNKVYPGGEREGVCGCEEDWDIGDEDDSDGDEDDSDEDDSDEEEVTLTERKTFLSGKQFLLKLFEVEKIEADLKKASVGLAHWVINCNICPLADSIKLLNSHIRCNMSMNNKILPANTQQYPQLWKISSDDAGKVSFHHLSARAIREELGILEEGDREMCAGSEVQENKGVRSIKTKTVGRVKAEFGILEEGDRDMCAGSEVQENKGVGSIKTKTVGRVKATAENKGVGSGKNKNVGRVKATAENKGVGSSKNKNVGRVIKGTGRYKA